MQHVYLGTHPGKFKLMPLMTKYPIVLKMKVNNTNIEQVANFHM